MTPKSTHAWLAPRVSPRRGKHDRGLPLSRGTRGAIRPLCRSRRGRQGKQLTRAKLFADCRGNCRAEGGRVMACRLCQAETPILAVLFYCSRPDGVLMFMVTRNPRTGLLYLSDPGEVGSPSGVCLTEGVPRGPWQGQAICALVHACVVTGNLRSEAPHGTTLKHQAPHGVLDGEETPFAGKRKAQLTHA